MYSNEIVKRHPFYSSCASTLNDVSNRDYPGTDYFDPSIECLDMDAYEHSLSKKNPDRTVDAVIGIALPHSASRSLLLIELKMGCTKLSSLSKGELEHKVCYTKSLLSGVCTIHKDSIFIFTEAMYQQAKSWFYRQSMCGGELRNSEVFSVSMFSNQVKKISSDYKPIHTQESITNSLERHRLDSDWQKFFNQIQYWCEQALKYKYRHENPEYENISSVLRNIWSDLDEKDFTSDDDVYYKKLNLEEDYNFLTQNTI